MVCVCCNTQLVVGLYPKLAGTNDILLVQPDRRALLTSDSLVIDIKKGSYF